jgi:hypothetical protein
MNAARKDAAQPQATDPPASDAINKLDLEEHIDRAQHLNALAQWISSARDTLDELRSSAKCDPVLAERLSARQGSYSGPEWTSFESDALFCLHMIIEENIEAIADATIKAPRSLQ